MAKKKTSEEYNNSSINVLEGLEGIRQRFNMYVGHQPIQHCIKEVLDNSIDEVMNGYANKVVVKVNTKKNSCVIQDNGRGIPNGMNPKIKKNNIEILHTMLHSGAKFDSNKEFKTSGGQNGVGLKALCALTKYLKVTSERDDSTRRYMEFSKGKATSKAIDEKVTGKTGTTTEFIPDDELLRKDLAKIDVEALKETCKMRTYLNTGLTIELYIDKEKFVYNADKGIETYIKDVTSDVLFNMEPIRIEGEVDGNVYDICFTFENTTDEVIEGFCNSIVLSRGTHETGFKKALTTSFTNYITNNNMLAKKDSNLNIKGEDVRKGLHCIMNMKIQDPSYSGQTKDELGNKEVITHVNQIVGSAMTDWIEQNDALMKKLCNRIIQFARASEAVKKAQDKIIKVSNNNLAMSVSNKFTDCFEKDPKKRELFICEGNSAGGSIVMARSKSNNFQAVYRLKGKILNTTGKETNTIMANKELSELVAIIFGTSDIKQIDYDNVKFGKICILTDSDDDGLHITSLLLSFFLENFPGLIEREMVYIALAPLYRITVKNSYVYFKNDAEYFNYKTRYLSELFETQNKHTVRDIVEMTDDFLAKVNTIKIKYAINDEIISMFMRDDKKTVYKQLKTNGVTVKGDYCQGLFDDIWLDLTVDDKFLADIDELRNDCSGETVITFKDIKENEYYECDIIDFMHHLDENFNFKRYRYKGLGEINAEELAETTLNPDKRDIIKVTMGDLKDAKDLNQILFGSNADKRKEFIQERI